jgi:hypothetical protein
LKGRKEGREEGREGRREGGRGGREREREENRPLCLFFYIFECSKCEINNIYIRL